MEKLFKAFVVSAAATLGVAVVLRHLDARLAPDSPSDERANGEVDADGLSPEERNAMLAELEGQL